MRKSEFTGTIFFIIPASLSAPYRSALQAVARLARLFVRPGDTSLRHKRHVGRLRRSTPDYRDKKVSEIPHTNATDTDLFHQADFTEYRQLCITHTHTHTQNSMLIRTQVKQQVESQHRLSLCAANTVRFRYRQHIQSLATTS